MNGALIAAHAGRRRREDDTLLDRFRLAGATSADRAQSIARLGLEPSAALARLEANGVVRTDERGRYYLDEAAVIARREARAGPPPGLLLVIGLLLLLGLSVLGWLQAG